MHDPMTVAFELRNPFKRYSTLLTVWHVDPEADGSDDSCGWSYPRLTSEQRSMMAHLAYCEAHTPWFQRDPVKRISSPADAESLMRGAIQMVAFCLKIKITWQEVSELACKLTHNSADNFQGSLCHLPGWHTNSPTDSESWRKDSATGFFCSVARILLQHNRPWWRHPRWHIRHWKIQIPLIQQFKRWMWSRCSRCGKGFRWGEAPCTNNWHSPGPQWFKGETDIYHSSCDGTQTVGPEH